MTDVLLNIWDMAAPIFTWRKSRMVLLGDPIERGVHCLEVGDMRCCRHYLSGHPLTKSKTSLRLAMATATQLSAPP